MKKMREKESGELYSVEKKKLAFFGKSAEMFYLVPSCLGVENDVSVPRRWCQRLLLIAKGRGFW